MKRKILLTGLAFILIKVLSAQIPSQISTVWQYQVLDTITNPYVKSDDFRLLPDTSIVFLTTTYKSPLFYLREEEDVYYFSKVSSNGSLLVNRKKVQFPSTSFKLINFDITADGGLIVLAREILDQRDDSAYLVKYDQNLNVVWQKNIFNGNTPSVIYIAAPSEVAALDNGKIIVHYNRSLPIRSFGASAAEIVGFADNGDSLYRLTVQNNIEKILEGSGNTFITKERIPFTEERPNYLRNAANGSIIKDISTVSISNPSFIRFLPSKDFLNLKYVRFSGSINGPSDFSLEILDSTLGTKGAIQFNNITLFKYWEVQLVKDQNAGLYASQSLEENGFSEYFGPYPGTDYFALCRLDSTGRELWSFKLDNPSASAGGRVGNIMPLAGNDFVIPVFSEAGVWLYRQRANFTTPGLPAFRRTSPDVEPTFLQKQTLQGVKDFSAKVLANPATDYFTLLIKSSDDENVTVTIRDLQGRLIETKQQVSANGTLRMGYNYRPGVYLIQVIQKRRTKMLKVIKQ
ncbi:MAG: T9SS type A sorting domain-containing protein [Chitinophagaceae bacterium]|nr:T9SS type A sorting domain-containing protein [Chitinophagaceae bacterium]